MKTITTWSIAMLCMLFITPVFAVNSGVIQEKSLYELINENLSVSEVLELEVIEIEERIGKKLTFKEKVGLSRAKRKITKLKSRGFSDAEISSKMRARNYDFKVIPFLLGFFFSIIGLIISWVLWGRNGLISSAYGAIISFLIGLIYGVSFWGR